MFVRGVASPKKAHMMKRGIPYGEKSLRKEKKSPPPPPHRERGQALIRRKGEKRPPTWKTLDGLDLRGGERLLLPSPQCT